MELSEFFAENRFYFLIAHVISVIFGMGAALISDVLFSFYAKDKKLSRREIKVLDVLSKVVWYSLIIIVISGIGIFLSDPAKYLASAKFLAKMSVVGVLIVNGYVLLKLVQPHLTNRKFFTGAKLRNIRRIAFACGAVSLVSWIGSFVLANLNSVPLTYTQIMSTYDLVLVIAILSAIIVEHRTYEMKHRP